MKYAKITGTGSYLPKKILTNAELEKMVDTTDEWIVERTGIRQRHILAADETATSMAIAAAEKAINVADVDPHDIDLIITATCTPDQLFPSIACKLQEKFGVKNCIAFDLSAACTGFIYALGVAQQFFATGAVKKALLVGSEAMSRIIDWNDRSTCVIFGDGAGAVVLETSEEPGLMSSHLFADGKLGDLLSLKLPLTSEKDDDNYEYVRMTAGNKVFKYAVTKLEQLVELTLAENGLDKSAVSWLIPHQANIRIIEATAKKLELPMDRVVCTIAEHGNTSGASIPLALDYAIQNGKIKRGDVLLLESFGGGLTWGSALIKY